MTASPTGCASTTRTAWPTPAATSTGSRRPRAAATFWVEKILEGEEQLPTSWATAGTTGYDALADIDRVLVDPAGPIGDRPSRFHPAGQHRSGLLAVAHPRNQARHRRRHPAERGAAARTRERPERQRGRHRRTAGLLSGLPLLSAARDRTPADRGQARERAPPRPRREDRVRSCRCSATPRIRRPSAFSRPREWSWRRASKTRPSTATADSARSPRSAQTRRSSRSTLAEFHRRQQLRQADIPRLADHAVDPRHQARRGCARQDLGARRDPARVGSGARPPCAKPFR